MWRYRKGLISIFSFYFLVGNILACPDVEVVTRAQWGAKTPQWTTSIQTPVKHIIIAHTVTPECHNKNDCSARMRSIQDFHRSLKWGDIGYNFVIGGDGRVYEGVGWRREGIHTLKWNKESYGISFIGNFMAARPNDKMLYAARKLIVCGIKKGYVAKDRWLHGARDATCTASPGDVLYNIIKQWPRFQGGPLSKYSC